MKACLIPLTTIHSSLPFNPERVSKVFCKKVKSNRYSLHTVFKNGTHTDYSITRNVRDDLIRHMAQRHNTTELVWMFDLSKKHIQRIVSNGGITCYRLNLARRIQVATNLLMQGQSRKEILQQVKLSDGLYNRLRLEIRRT